MADNPFNVPPQDLDALLANLPEQGEAMPEWAKWFNRHVLGNVDMARAYPGLVLDRMLGRPNPLGEYQQQEANVLLPAIIDAAGNRSYAPGPRESEMFEDNRPTSIWSWPR